MRKPRRPTASNGYYYPVDIDQLAADLVARDIDIAPTRQAWTAVARDIADGAGEAGRAAFHLIASVWPDYSRRDSEHCFDRALRVADGSRVMMPYIKRACQRHGINVGSSRYRMGGPVKIPPVIVKQPNIKPVMIDKEKFRRSLPDGRSLRGRCPLTDLLLNLFPQQAVIDAVDDYQIGFNAFINNTVGDAMIFWQIDQHCNIVNAKRIYYKSNGHRDKRYCPMVMFPANGQCLFGLHLLKEKPDKTIGIVESEKSALIMAISDPSMLWMATGSLDNFNEKMLIPLKGRKVIAYPYLDNKRGKGGVYSYTLEQWRKTAVELSKYGLDITVSDKLEKMANGAKRLAKWDIADFVIYSKIYNL